MSTGGLAQPDLSPCIPSSTSFTVILRVAPGVTLDGPRGEKGNVGSLEDEVGPEDMQHDEGGEQNTEYVVGGEILHG